MTGSLFRNATASLVAEKYAKLALGSPRVRTHVQAWTTLEQILRRIEKGYRATGSLDLALLGRSLVRVRRENRAHWLEIIGIGDSRSTVADRVVPAGRRCGPFRCGLCGGDGEGVAVSCGNAAFHRGCMLEHVGNVLQVVYTEDVVLCPCGCGADVFMDLV